MTTGDTVLLPLQMLQICRYRIDLTVAAPPAPAYIRQVRLWANAQMP
jgi:hypothetical protein